MTDKPPADPADHAEDFSRRYAEDLDIVAGPAMMDLGIPDNQRGSATIPEGAGSTASSPATGKVEPSHMPDR
jgi:hypothetical protein